MVFLTTFISSLLVNNVILSGTKGLCSYIGLSKDKKATLGMSIALIVVCVLSGLISWGLAALLTLINATYLSTIVSILVIASFVQLLEIFIKKFLPSLYKSLGIYLPLITTNCVVMGLAISIFSTYAKFIDGSLSSLDSALTILGMILAYPLGYFMVIYVFAFIQDRIQNNGETPRGFKGAAIAFIATAAMCLAIYGFTGLV